MAIGASYNEGPDIKDPLVRVILWVAFSLRLIPDYTDQPPLDIAQPTRLSMLELGASLVQTDYS